MKRYNHKIGRPLAGSCQVAICRQAVALIREKETAHDDTNVLFCSQSVVSTLCGNFSPRHFCKSKEGQDSGLPVQLQGLICCPFCIVLLESRVSTISRHAAGQV